MASEELIRELIQLMSRLVQTVEEMNEKLDHLLSIQPADKKPEARRDTTTSPLLEEDAHADRVSDVVTIIREKGAMSADELAKYFNIKRSTASYYLNQAVKQGVLKKFRESRTKKVFFSPIKHSNKILRKKNDESK